MIRGIAVLVLLVLNLIVWGTPVFLFGLFKVVLRGRARHRLILFVASLGENWVAGNNRIFDAWLPTRWEIDLPGDLRHDGHYLLFSNHISWVDIPVLFRAFHRRTPLIRFFLKRQLAWVPFVGQASWALEFPFMRRYSADELARHPEKRGQDLETTRRACERYRDIPVSILNFLEGTRFSYEKHAEQESPYRHLLRPRSGGASFVLASLGDKLDGVLDVTIAYAKQDITFWDFLRGRVASVKVRARDLAVPPEFLTSAVVEGPVRDAFKQWIRKVWAEKDGILDRNLD